ncbi:MAG: hypothetical protein ABSH09_28900 [Bryobacteraceae bacterium]
MALVLSGPHWKVKALLAVLVLSLLRAFPSYEALKTPFVESTWSHTFLQIDNLICDMGRLFPPGSHESKMTFRLTVPLLARLLGLNETGILILSAIAGIVLLYVSLVLLYKITKSKESALFICLTIACAWAGQTGFQELRGGFYDSVALCLLLIAMAANSPVIAGVCAFLAAWTDERALIAGAFVVLLSIAMHERAKTIAVLVGWCGYAVLRLWMTSHYSLAVATGNIGFDVLAQQIRLIPIGVWSGLGGCWIVICAGLASAIRQHRYTLTAAFCALLAATIVSALMVLDVTRSIAYCLPAVFVATYLLKDEPWLKRLALWSGIGSFFVPTWYVQGDTMLWYIYPLPLQLARWFAPH